MLSWSEAAVVVLAVPVAIAVIERDEPAIFEDDEQVLAKPSDKVAQIVAEPLR